MIETGKIYNEDCFNTMNKMIESNYQVNNIITQPPESVNFIDLFVCFDKILKKNGVILISLMYNKDSPIKTYETIVNIEKYTNFKLADIITWIKHPVLPNNMNKNRLTRQHEEIYVFCRKDEFKTFKTNKKVVSVRESGQLNYSNLNNVIHAPIRDKKVKTFKHNVFSTDLVLELLNMYVKKSYIVYNPFSGTGTVFNACVIYKCKCIGSEIDKEQVEYARKRIINTRLELRKRNN